MVGGGVRRGTTWVTSGPPDYSRRCSQSGSAITVAIGMTTVLLSWLNPSSFCEKKDLANCLLQKSSSNNKKKGNLLLYNLLVLGKKCPTGTENVTCCVNDDVAITCMLYRDWPTHHRGSRAEEDSSTLPFEDVFAHWPSVIGVGDSKPQAPPSPQPLHAGPLSVCTVVGLG